MKYLAVFILLTASQAAAQAERVHLRGLVHDHAATPVGAANVFIMGTLDGTLTDSTGRFDISTPTRSSFTIAVRRLGFRDTTILVAHARDEILITLGTATQPLTPIVVQAGRYAAADEPGAVLTPLEIVTIPGTAGDANRALQTLPGVAQVDEGTGLYVRGGDFTETRVYLNEGLLLTPAQIQAAAGTFVGRLDPFLLDAVYFTSGGFGARYGEALSAIASLHTQGRPERHSATLSVGLAAMGFNIALPGPGGTGLRLVGDRTDLTPVVRLNGSPRQFTSAPHGVDRTVSAFWNYRPTARLSLFTTDQTEKLGTLNETPSVVDTFAVDNRNRSTVLSWRDLFGRVAPEVVLSESDVHRVESYGSYDLTSPTRLRQVAVSADVALNEGNTLRIGAEQGHLSAHMDGSLPLSGDDQRPDARVRTFEVDRTTTRTGTYAELDTRPLPPVRLVAGIRRDQSTGARNATIDSRLSASIRMGEHATAMAAVGTYHQTVDPLLQMLTLTPAVNLPAMESRQAIAGLQVGENAPMVRLELYHKSYTDLAAADRNFITVGGGKGTAYGVDVIARAPALVGIGPRVVYTYARSTRTDPNTGVEALAPFDVPHNVTLIASRALPMMVILGASIRYASGRPFTPVTSATRSTGDALWTPHYGLAASERLPAFSRVDLSASWYHVTSAGTQLVAYASVTNLLDRSNVYTRRYTADYTVRYDVRSIFNRSLYFGGVITFTDK